MAEYPVYDGVGKEFAGGVLTMDAPVSSPPAPEPHRGPSVTTGDVQRVAEQTEGVIEGGGVYAPFGPVLDLDPDNAPDFRVVWTDDGPKRAFRVAESTGMMPLLRFAHSAKSGVSSEDMEGLAALYEMIRDAVDESDWDVFQDYATTTKADDEELLAFVSAAIEVISARKARQRGSSSRTSPRTSAKSKVSSSRQASVIPPGAIVPPEADGLMSVSDMVR